ncbi:MAG: hypothetical protein A2X94_06445 [Bdellovibrionales bacterium GWB1_55_8]|nr:MAG: hypothetical protein A2X94_06445 [Bdellovibrionales bacterium GWB1_55_8]
MKLFASALVALFAVPAFAGSVHHELDVILDPTSHRLAVTDRVVLTDQRKNISESERMTFTLHRGLSPLSRTPGVIILPPSSRLPGSLSESEPTDPKEPLEERYQVILPPGVSEFALQYSGVIHHPLSTDEEEYARGFRDTPGFIGDEGIYLASSSYWYARFGDELVSFSLNVSLPAAWDSVSQGDRVFHERAERTRATWSSPELQDDIYLIGGQFTEYSKAGSGTLAMAFLTTPDPELAERYLNATTSYLEMYNRLIGAYPFRKFALVENFWETGYGMPSFTLLGPKIIRFPFILQSSYPHEILHNWWGNSVYVDYATGNWCEGLTAYLADHLLKEQAGGGAEYRRDTLQKYSSYVTGGNDFPLTEFRERHNPATEAVGYGKALGFYHMLRRSLGDEVFVRGLRDFYSSQKFQRAGFQDLRASMERVSGLNLDFEFEQWVSRAGAPELKIQATPRALPLDPQGAGPVEHDRYELHFALEQTQEGPGYRIQVPLAVDLEGQQGAYQTVVRMDNRTLDVQLRVPGKPVRVHVDPEFDIFRRLHPLEIPPTVSRALGAGKLLVIVPAGAAAPLQQAYMELARIWVGSEPSADREIRMDSEVSVIPADRTVWLLGWENKFRLQAIDSLSAYGVSSSTAGIRIGDFDVASKTQTFVGIGRNPNQLAEALGWVAIGEAQGVAGIAALGRKLPHYGKYGYLAFEGADAKNIAKGIWPSINSPLSAEVIFPNGSHGSGPRAKLAPRPALAEIPDVFQAKALQEHVVYLAQEALKGREPGTPEIDLAADYLAGKLREFGITPAGENGFFQSWTEHLAAPKGEIRLTNVLGRISGRNSALEPVVIGAHYDHLGLGWPDAHAENRGKVHPGADDNASGVSVLLEVARAFGARSRAGVTFERTIVFAFFTGEEGGLLGSRHFVKTAQEKYVAMINLDTVGRIASGSFQVLGTGSAKEWSGLFKGVEFMTSVPLSLVPQDFGGSDQRSFREIGVAAVHFFSGPTADYHRPSDTAEKLDYAGMVNVAKVAREALVIIANRSTPFTEVAPNPDQPPPSGERKAFLGTVPDFSFAGPGVRAAQIVPGSPAEKAGLIAQDIVLQMDKHVIAGLREYSVLLKSFKPGQEVDIVYSRGGIERSCRAVLSER